MTATQQNLLDALGIDNLLPGEQEELLLDLNDLVFKGAMVRLLETLDDKTKDDLNTLLDTDPLEDEIQSFLAKHVPQTDQAVADTVKELTDDILAVTGASQD